MKDTSNRLPCIVLLIILFIVRIIANNTECIDQFSSIIVIASFCIALYSLIYQIQNAIINEIEHATTIADEVKERERKKVERKTPYIIGFICCGILFVICIKTGEFTFYNDLISIFALGLSLADSSVSDAISKSYTRDLE